MSAVTWLLLAGAVWFWGSRRQTARVLPSPRPGRRPVSTPTLQVAAGLAGAVVCVAAFGVRPGGLSACVVAPATAYLVRRLDQRKVRAPPGRDLALCLDLVAAALAGGQPLPSALALAAPVAEPATAAKFSHVAGLLRLGADPGEAWRELTDDDVLAPVAQAACRSADSGIRLARGFEQVAADVRAHVRAAAQARAHRAGVWAIAPLGLCFLPAFVCLGVVPVVVGIARDAFGGLP
jgi:Flp pilus assembly protein TadB